MVLGLGLLLGSQSCTNSQRDRNERWKMVQAELPKEALILDVVIDEDKLTARWLVAEKRYAMSVGAKGKVGPKEIELESILPLKELAFSPDDLDMAVLDKAIEALPKQLDGLKPELKSLRAGRPKNGGGASPRWEYQGRAGNFNVFAQITFDGQLGIVQKSKALD